MIYTGPNQANLEKYGKNQVHKAWVESDTVVYSNGVEGNDEYSTEFTTYLCKGKPKFIYDGRFCAVSGFIFAIVNGKYSVLANKRGSGTPDYQGYWNCPCGYIDWDETLDDAMIREIHEETGLNLSIENLTQVYINSDPKENRQNITIRYIGIIDDMISYCDFSKEYSEKDEIEDIKWISIDTIDEYKWAFDHNLIIRELYNKYIDIPWYKKTILKYYQKWFKI